MWKYIVNVLDVAMMINIANGDFEFENEQEETIIRQRADLNDDNIVNIQDIVILINIILGG